MADDIDLGAAFDASANPYTLLTTDFRYAGMNQAYLDVTERTREELLGRSLFEAFTGGVDDDAPENVRQLMRSFQRVLETGERDHLALIRYPIPVRGPDGETVFEDRYWSATHTPIRDRSGAILYILQHTTDVTELERLRQRVEAADTTTPLTALDAIIGGDLITRANLVQADNRRLESERNRLVEMFMQAPGFVAVLTGPDHVFQMHNDAYATLIGGRAVQGRTVRDALPDIEGQGFYELLDQVFTTGVPYEGRAAPITLQTTPESPPEDRFLDFIYQPVRTADGDIAGIFVQGHDVTDSVRAAERQKLMIDELNHRVKNTLATVQSIAMQTARSNVDPARFAQSFQARLLALSHTHDLLTRSHWEGADLRDILTHETDAHGATRVILNGPSVSLDPAAALSLGMIFHELATNAAKYGALSVGEGRVFVDWSLSAGDRPRLTLDWRERDGPPVTEPERRGFGSRLIERNVRHDLAGDVKLSYPTDGFRAEISVPLDRGRPS